LCAARCLGACTRIAWTEATEKSGSSQIITDISRDFRSTRIKLPPDAFAIAPKEPIPPTDPIDKPSWAGIVHVADAVSIITSDDHGTVFRDAYELWGLWVALVLDVQSLLPDPK
jgi:hypothetical protein